jgi:hypothetical protein
MKKYFSILASVIMLVALSTPALAEGGCNNCVQETSDFAVSNAYKFDAGGGYLNGGWGEVDAYGDTYSYAKGKKYVEAGAKAESTALTLGDGFTVAGPNAMLSGAGSLAAGKVELKGDAKGLDRPWTCDTADYAYTNMYANINVATGSHANAFTGLYNFSGASGYAGVNASAWDNEYDSGTFLCQDWLDKDAYVWDDMSLAAGAADGSIAGAFTNPAGTKSMVFSANVGLAGYYADAPYAQGFLSGNGRATGQSYAKGYNAEAVAGYDASWCLSQNVYGNAGIGGGVAAGYATTSIEKSGGILKVTATSRSFSAAGTSGGVPGNTLVGNGSY